MRLQKKINPSTRKQSLKQIALMIANGEKIETIKPGWVKLVADIAGSGDKIDVNDLVQGVLKQSYLECSRDPQLQAEKVDRLSKKQKEIRNRISKLQEELNSAGEDTQLANMDLQNSLQRQQQTLQMMSNISKALHDSATSVIQNIKG